MLRIFHGNRLEPLTARLAAALVCPVGGVLEPQRVVLQNPGMGQWLAQQLALAHGISANTEFPLPATFMWEVLSTQLPDVPAENHYHRDVLAWRAMAALPGLFGDPAFAEVARYVAMDDDGRRLHRLSGRCAGLFDQYLVYRPEWINAWDRGEQGHWQARLWRAISPPGPPRHWAALVTEFVGRCTAGTLVASALPERVSVFGLSALAPAYLEALKGIAGVVQVDLYLLNPSQAYWGDIASDRELARHRDRWRRAGQSDVSAYYDVGHPLLASLGAQGREFFEQIQELGCQEEELFEDPGADTRLHRLQQDILVLRDRRMQGMEPAALAAADASLQVHGCHSDLREVQVLQDRLLELFETLPGLLPGDVMVMAPDMGRYAPHVAAVFGTAPPRRAIPFSLAHQGLAAEDPHAQGVLALLALPQGRLEASTVLGLLDLPALGRRFGLGAEDLADIHQWVEDSGIRWGLDEADREAAGLATSGRNTWRFGLRRLLLGYALPDGAGAFEEVLPLAGVEGGGAARVGGLAALVETVARWRERLARPASLTAWRERVNQLLADFFAPVDEEMEVFQVLHRLFDDLVREAGQAIPAPVLTPEVFRDTVAARLDEVEAGQGFLTGPVTFCDLVPMRSIPFRVVCVLGMNEGEFPRIQRPAGFDLMAAAPRRGDRSRRNDDRFLFLEALLSARDVFYISYQSRDIRDNSERVPSVVVSDVMEYVAGAEPQAAPGLPCQHPLQPFSHRYFDGAGGLFSYAEQWRPGAGAAPVPFAADPLPEPAAEWRNVDLRAVMDFFANPARYLLRHRLGVHYREAGATVADSEPFTLDGLERYRVRQEVLAAGPQAVDDGGAVRGWLEATGAAPHGAFAALEVEALLAPVAPMAAELAVLTREPAEAVEVDLVLGDFHLTGWLEDVRPGGLVRSRPARLRPKDRLALWMEHLALGAVAPSGVALHSRLLMLDARFSLAAVDRPRLLLEQLLELYWRGLAAPLPFFVECSWAYAEARLRDKGQERALRAATARWQDGFAHSGEGGDPYISTAWRGREPFAEPFGEIALTVFGPVLDHGEEG